MSGAGAVSDPHPPPRSPWGNAGTQEQAGSVVRAPEQNLVGITNSKVIFVDSRTRNIDRNLQASDFDIKFHDAFRNVTSIRLLSALIPIFNAAVHTEPAGVTYDPNPFVILQVEPIGQRSTTLLSGTVGIGASNAADQDTRNHIADDNGMVVIPLSTSGTSIAVGGNTVEFASWRELPNHAAVIRFKPPVATLTGLRLRLATWGASATQARGDYNTYPLDEEASPASAVAASGLEPENQVQYVFEIVGTN